jgi:hypothetical protein
MTMKDKVNHPGPDTAAELTGLAAWIDEQLGDETASRQWIAESTAARVRDITLQMLGAAPLPAWHSTVGQAFRDGIRYQQAFLAAPCQDCRNLRGLPGRLCEAHRAAADQIALYRSVGRTLGIEGDR